MATAIGTAVAVWPFIDSMRPSADVGALASVEIDLSLFEPGQRVTVKWRSRPVFIVHRTQAMIEQAKADDSSPALIDPRGPYGGWFCPCHGSIYDSAGRVRKGPAPRNLEVPPYEFLDNNRVQIG